MQKYIFFSITTQLNQNNLHDWTIFVKKAPDK